LDLSAIAAKSSEFLTKISIWAIPALFAITLHEVAHGWTARLFGDRTAQMLGRLSLNPLRHIDPVGTVLVPGVLLALGAPIIGWARPVPVAVSALRSPRRGMILVALAGPAANILMALVWCVVLAGAARSHFSGTVLNWVALMAEAGIWLNAGLAVFNLLPIPPLDGSRVVRNMLPYNAVQVYDRIGGWISYLLMIFVGGFILRLLLWPALGFVFSLLGRL
jgi:Zn-dependent protease